MLKANLFAVCWGIANVLLGISYVRIGATLSGAILTGLGLCVGMLLPFVLKGTGVTKQSRGGNLAGLHIILSSRFWYDRTWQFLLRDPVMIWSAGIVVTPIQLRIVMSSTSNFWIVSRLHREQTRQNVD